jgi:signal peptidase I
MRTKSLALGISLVLTGCAAVTSLQPVRIQGTAMLPGLKDGDRAIFSHHFDGPARGDIVVFYYPAEPSKSYIKRIIGLPNEELEIRDGKVLINGQGITEPYVDARLNVSARSYGPLKIPADNYFVMGDNRDNSNDSRSWGPLPRSFIYGRFVRKY